jgi:hypothetical protein
MFHFSFFFLSFWAFLFSHSTEEEETWSISQMPSIDAE